MRVRSEGVVDNPTTKMLPSGGAAAHERTCLITGATSGVGLELAAQLATQHGIKVIVGARSAAKSRDAVKALQARYPDHQELFVASPDMDIDDFDQIRASVDSLDSKLDMLVLNAGVLNMKKNVVAPKTGLEVCFSGKVVGHYVLLMQLLKKEKLKEGGTVLFVGSESGTGGLLGVKLIDVKHLATKRFNNDVPNAIEAALKGNLGRSGMYNYATANQFGVLWTLTIAPQLLVAKGIRMFATSPGSVLSTKIHRNAGCFTIQISKIMSHLVFGGTLTEDTSVKERYVKLLLWPDKFEVGRFYASPYKKLAGPLTLQEAPPVMDRELGLLVIKAIEKVSGEGRPDWLRL